MKKEESGFRSGQAVPGALELVSGARIMLSAWDGDLIPRSALEASLVCGRADDPLFPRPGHHKPDAVIAAISV